jgi:hypothetical protein
MSTTFQASKYAGITASAIWTFGWLVPAWLAGQRLAANSDKSSLGCIIVSAVFVVLGGGMTMRFCKRINYVAETKDQPETGSWSRRAGGWVGAFVWCAAAVVWNLGIEGTLIRAARDGQFITFLMLIPFSLIGWLLLLVLFTGIAVVIESLFHEDETVKRPP